jgi:PAS domain S-box-containing protein
MTDLHSLLVNEAPIGIAALSVENTILFWNKKAEAIFGFTSEQAVGQSIHSLIIPTLYQEQSRKATDIALERGSFLYECISRGKQGSELTVEIQLSRQMKDQQVILVCTMRLLPERKEELNKKNVHETTEFLATMSHELRTPLNSIVGFTEFLLEDQPGTLSTKQREYLGDVLASGKQLLNLINAMLDLAKIETGKISVVPEDFNVGTVL